MKLNTMYNKLTTLLTGDQRLHLICKKHKISLKDDGGRTEKAVYNINTPSDKNATLTIEKVNTAYDDYITVAINDKLYETLGNADAEIRTERDILIFALDLITTLCFIAKL